MIEPDGEDVLIRIKAVPGASRDGIAGAVGDRLKVRVSAPPEGGHANRAICRLVAAALGVRPRQVTIERGRTSPEKTLRVTRCDADLARAAFG
jgi:uncharacterized protein (TIGR00251 family)